jgi:hypothetical protein
MTVLAETLLLVGFFILVMVREMYRLSRDD